MSLPICRRIWQLQKTIFFELYKAIVDKKKKKYVPIEYLFESREQAEKAFFYILKNIYESMKKKKWNIVRWCSHGMGWYFPNMICFRG